MSADIVVSFFQSAIVASVPLVYAAVGEVFNQRSGLMNLGLEGVMLMGAVTGYMAVVATESLLWSVIIALMAGLVMGLLFGFLVITLKADQTVCGLAISIFGTGLSGYIGRTVSGIPAFVTFKPVSIPLLSKIPILGPIFFEQDVLVYAMYILVIAAWFYIYKTRQGLVLRSLGESPQTADALGINVFRLRYFYTCIGSILGALGGAYLTLAYTPLWADKMTSGKGWIALAIVIFATWNPLLVAVGALLFGGVQVLALRMQVAGVGIPSQFLNMLPYLLTLIVLILSTGEIGGKKKGNSIKALGQPYDREDR